MSKAFLSHSSADDRYVVELEQLLRLSFTEVFNDGHSIAPDEEFWKRIEQGILACDAFVVVLSRASVTSFWVDREVQFARQNGKRVVPIRIEDCKLPASFDGRDVIELRPGAVLKARISPPRFLHHSAEFFLGRERELALLDSAWADGTNVLSIVAWGGVGKTALLAEWLQKRFIDRLWLDADGRPALLAYFDWSFYDQGTRALAEGIVTRTGSVGDFFEQALAFFGDDDPSRPGKGARLAGFIRQQRTLLILDGLEPLQHPVGNAQAGRLLDPDLRDLLWALAQENPGLCVLTSRQSVADLDGLHGRAAKKEELDDLPKAVAVSLLRKLQIRGTDQELEEACDKFGCHALSLTLLGRFLFDAHGGDINRIDRIRDLEKADRLTRDQRHRTAWRVLAAYEEWLARANSNGQPTTLAVLRLTGLFDRVATADCLAVLRAAPVIPGLTESIHALDHDEWIILLRRLERAHLIKLRASADTPEALAVDAHPLVREYFAKQLREQQPEAFRAAHSRLFDHLCESTEHQPDTLPGLQPLYQAVTHGCLAGRQPEALIDVHIDRILRGTRPGGFYSRDQLGASGSDLGALAAFFEEPWSRLSPNLRAPGQAWLLNEAAMSLRALGRLTEALEPMRVGLERRIETDDWRNAAASASNLSELEVTLGRLLEAVADGYRSVEFADQSGDTFQKITERTVTADALHQAGERARARTLFADAERMQAKSQPEFHFLYSVRGFRYADLLLAPAERAAWKAITSFSSSSLLPPVARPPGAETSLGGPKPGTTLEEALASCAEAERRAIKTVEWATNHSLGLLTIALEHLTLVRARLYVGLLSHERQAEISNLEFEIRQALAKLREANQSDELPKALLTAALHAGTIGAQPDEARRYLDEAQLIAERGPMPLYLADVHLHRARLFRDRAALAAARDLIKKHGYYRRREELADAEATLS